MKRMSTRSLSIVLTVALLLLNTLTSFAAYDYPLLDLVFTDAGTLADDTSDWYNNKLVGTVTVDIQEPSTELEITSFGDCDNLTSVYINIEDASSNLEIGSFVDCDALIELTIKSNGNVTIDENCFGYCDLLKTVNFDVKGTVTINTSAFEGCSSLSEIDFAKCGKVILYGEYCFRWSGLKEVHFTSNVSFDCDEEMWENGDGSCHFVACENLEKFTADCNELTFGMFWHCSSLKKAYITNNVLRIDNSTFGTVGSEGMTVYGYTASATEEYCDKYGLKFIPVDSAEFNTITSSQSADATVGVPSAVTLSVAGFPESLKLESPLCSEVIFSREDAEIVTSETGELWTVNLTPMSEADTYTVTADYGLADLCATDEITIFAEEDTTPPVISVETATPAVLGEYAKVNVTVKNSPEAIRFVDDNVTTIEREDAVITENDNNTETWEVNLLVASEEQQLTVFAKDETGWLTQGTDFTLKAKVIDYSTEISDFAFEESLDGVIYNGMNKITLTTANGISKVQFMKNGNTWTYTEDTAEVIEVDGKKHWTIKMNFWALGDQTYDIRVRTPKTTFEVTDTLNVTVYSR